MSLLSVDHKHVVLNTLVRLSETRYGRADTTELARETGLPLQEVAETVSELREHGLVKAVMLPAADGGEAPLQARAVRLTVTGRRLVGK